MKKEVKGKGNYSWLCKKSMDSSQNLYGYTDTYAITFYLFRELEKNDMYSYTDEL